MMAHGQEPPRGMWACVLAALRQYATFRGRATRAEFWYFLLFSSALVLPLGIAERVLRHADSVEAALVHDLCLYLRLLLRLTFFLPMLAVSVRRMHDTGRSGWVAVCPFLLPLVGIPLIAWGAHMAGNAIVDETALPLWGGLAPVVVGGIMLIATLAWLIYVLICAAQDSDPKSNTYGPSAKYPPV